MKNCLVCTTTANTLMLYDDDDDDDGYDATAAVDDVDVVGLGGASVDDGGAAVALQRHH